MLLGPQELPILSSDIPDVAVAPYASNTLHNDISNYLGLHSTQSLQLAARFL